MSSPGVYLRCSENSTEKPWKGLARRPDRNPSTMNLARRSRRATWRTTSGRRYFSWPLMAVHLRRWGLLHLHPTIHVSADKARILLGHYPAGPRNGPDEREPP